MPSTCRSYATSQGNSIGSTTTRTRRATRRGAPGSVRAAFWPASRGVGCSARRPLLRCITQGFFLFYLHASASAHRNLCPLPFSTAPLPLPFCHRLFASLPLCLSAYLPLPPYPEVPCCRCCRHLFHVPLRRGGRRRDTFHQAQHLSHSSKGLRDSLAVCAFT